MPKSDLKEKIGSLIEGPLRSEGCEIVDIVVSHYKSNTTVRVFIYSEHGTTIDECARLSRIIGDLIDGTDWFESRYTLEVSSPGLDRPLKDARDFKYRTGETVRIQFANGSRKEMTAEIMDVSDGEVRVRHDAETVTIPLSEITQARIVL